MTSVSQNIEQLKYELEEQKKLTKEVELFYGESMQLENMTNIHKLEEQTKKTKEAELIAEEAFKLCVKLLNITTLRSKYV